MHVSFCRKSCSWSSSVVWSDSSNLVQVSWDLMATVYALFLSYFRITFHTWPLSADETAANSEKASIAEVEPLVKDFASRYKAAIELMHYDVITSFSNFLCGMEILRATLAQLLLYYTRLSECVKRINGGSALNKDLVSISSILFEIKKYSRTF